MIQFAADAGRRRARRSASKNAAVGGRAREEPRLLGPEAQLGDVPARGARPGARAAAANLFDPRAVGFERREVGLGEVPVVERLLLRTQRVRRARLLVEVPRLLDERLTVLERVALPLLLEPQRAFERADRVEVLDLDLGAERGLARAPRRDVRVAAERPLLHPDVRDVERLERRAQLGEVGARLLGRAHVGLGHALDERHAGAVVVDEGVVGLPDPSAGARRARSCPCPPPCARA